MSTGNGSIFIFTREDVIGCAGELGIPEDTITDDVLNRVKKGVEWGLECWSEVVETALREVLDKSVRKGEESSKT